MVFDKSENYEQILRVKKAEQSARMQAIKNSQMQNRNKEKTV